MIVSMYELNVLLASLLSVTAVSIILLVRTIKNLKYERDSAQEKNKADSKILFLKSRYASMGETVGNIAHQWKQPLNAIGSIQNSIKASLIFQGEISKEKLLDSVDKSFKLLQHLGETIDTFYSFLSQRNNEEMSFAIADELESIRKITEYSFQNSRIKLDFILDTNPMIQGNPNEFTHALLNLILNAKDAFDGSENDSPTITVHVRDGNDICTITISDNAGGIRVEPIEMVFDLHISTKEEGSGLGLFMTKNIIEKRFGGTIGVENKNGGACFTITLPYAEYGEYFSPETATDEKLSLARINQLTHKIIELEELEKTLRKWADIFKQAHWAIAMHAGKSSTFELTNAAFHTLYGYTAQELKTLSVPDLFTPQSLPLLSKVQQEAFEKGYVAFESLHQRKDGTTFPVSVELIAVKDDEGEILYHIANIWDLTEKKAAEERLQLKKFALDHIKDAVFLIDENARFHYVNEGTCKALGYSREEFEGMCVGDVDPDWPHERWGEHWEVLKQSGSITMELRHKRKDGTIFPVEVSANYIEYGGKHYNMAIARDITERKAAEKDLLLINKALNNTNDAVYITILGTIIQVNDGACKMLGYSREEFASMTLIDIDKDVTPEDIEAIVLDITNNGSARFERKHYTKDGRVLDVEIVGNFFEHEGVTYSFSSVRDITEQKKAREELLLKEFALNRINEAVYLIDEDSMFHYVNDEACKELGYTKEELLTMGVIHIDPNATHEWWNNHWAALKEEKNFTVETSHRRKDGTLFPIEVSINYFEYNGIGYNLAVVRDITERLQLEAQKDNERMKLFFERQLVGMAITSPEKGWLHTNEKLQQMLGYSHEELSALTWTEMTYPEDLAPDIEQFEKLLRGEIEDYILEKRFIRKDGNIVYTNLAVSCVRNDDRTVNYVLALLEDITERKAAQEALAAKEEQFRTLVENLPDNIIRYDKECRAIYVSPTMERVIGHQAVSHLMGITPIESDPKDAFDSARYQQTLEQVLNSGEIAEIETEIPSPSGKREFHLIRFVAERDSKGEICGAIIIGRDITEKRESEKTLEMFGQALSHASESIFITDENTSHFIFVNDTAAKTLEYSKEELTGGMGVADIDPGVDMGILTQIMQEIKTKGSVNIESKHRSKSGRVYPIDVTSHYFEYEGKGYFLAITRDITERKAAQEALAAKEREFRSLAENTPDNIARWDVERRYLYINPVQERLLCVTPEDIIGKSLSEAFPNVDFSILDGAMAQVIETGEEVRFVRQPFQNIHGDMEFHNINLVPERDSSGKIVGVLGIGRDMTDIYRMQDEIATKEQELRALADTSPGMMGAFHMRPDGSIYMPYVSPNIIDIFGIEPHEVAKDAMVVMALTHPDDADRIHISILESAHSMSIWHEEYRILHPIKGERWMESNTMPQPHPQGGIIWYGYVHDITERKEAEQKLSDSHAFLMKLIDSLPDPIFVKDRNHRWLILNQANCDLVGLPREQLLGKSDYDFFPKEEADVFRENDEIVFSSGKINVNEEYFTSTNGTTHYIQTIKAMFTANDGHEYLVGTIRDLSERKVMEDNLREALEFNEGIIAAIPDLLFEIAPDGTYIGIWAQDQAMLAAQKEVLLGQKFQEILPPNAVITSLQAMREVDEKGVSLGKNYSLDLPEGKRWFELSVSKEKMSGNYIALSRDITERKEIEALLEKERKFLIDAQRVAHTGSWYLDIQQGILTWSDETYRIFEFDKENIDDLHKAFYACVHPDDREMVEAPYVETLKTKLPYEIEHRIVMADGRIKYVIERCEHVYDNEGTPLFSIGTVQDITERKAAEEALQSNRNLLNTILESSPGIITFALDTHYRYIAFDSKHAEVIRTIFGEEIALGMNMLEAITSDADREIAKRSFDRTLGGESFIAEEEYGDERLSRHYWQIFYSPIHSETGEVIGLTCFNVDITQRREKEETIRELNTVLEEKVKERTLQLQEAFIELQEREEKFFQLFKLSPAAISITSLERNIYLEVNDSFLTYTGFERDDVVGHSSADLGIFVYPQERDELFRRIAEEGIVNDFRYSFRSKTGEIGYAAAYGSVIIYRGEKCYLGHSYDMSAYKDIESMQRERLVLEERLSTLAASVPGVNYIFERTAEGTVRFTYLAPTFEALFGFSMESAMNDFNIVMEYIHPDDRDTIRQSIFVTARDLSDWNEEFRIHHPQKGLLWIEGQSSPVLQEDGGILWYGFFYNITERKQTEKALRESEETFRAIVENSPDVISRYDLKMRRTYVNPMMEFLMGKPSEELIGKTPREFSPLPDVETFEQLFNAVVRGKSEIEHEDIYTAPWGEKRWGNQRLVPEFDEDQNVISVMVIGRDMTERLEVEKRLKLLETAINSADEAIYIIDDNNRIVYVSNAAYRMLGYTKEEFMGKNILDIDVHLNYHDLCDIFKNVPDDTKFTFETKQQTKEGKFLNVEVHTTCFMYEGIGFGVLVVNEISLK